MTKLLFSILLVLPLYANVAVTGDDYKKIRQEGVELLYATEYEGVAKHVLDFETSLIDTYTKSFGFSLDDTQYMGLLSSHNQVANAYSSQIPLNLQMNFGGGAMAVDYFSGSSWIETLLLHESAHNFQLNPKKNLLSYYAHKVVKNSFLTSLIFVPVFPVPNMAESSFILEGNAVLNESWHNRGGRLYNGSLLALALTQARAGYITPERTYNDHLYFPYGTHHYIVGGFFQLFLAQTYGIDKTNGYFYNFSGQWLPIFTNSVFKETFGKDFETLLAEYNDWLLTHYAGFQATKGKEIFRSQSAVKLNSDAQEVYFLTTDRYSAPHLMRYMKKTKEYKEKKADYSFGKVFKKADNFYTLASEYTSPTRIMIGLYDEDGKILQGSQSKAVQSLHGDKMVYFDIPSSFDKPQMFVDGSHYATVNSSVFTDYHDNHYYFVQEGKTRTLYKNREKLFSMQGYFGFVCDVEDEKVYFISNSQNGSSLYAYHDGQITRMVSGDDVVDARLIGANKALVETIDAEGMSFKEVVLESEASLVAEVRYFFEDDKRFLMPVREGNSTKSEPYTPLTNLHYTSLTQSVTSTGNEIDFDIAANFSDPLSQNRVTLFVSKISEDTIAGVGYDSSAYRLNFGASLFGTLSHDENISSRGYGTYLYMAYPLMHNTYEKMGLKLSYLLEDDKAEKEPLTLSLNYTNHKHFGQSMYLNEANDFSLALGLDREDKSAGATYHYSTSFAHQFYAGFNLKGAVSDVEQGGNKRGLRVKQYQTRFSNALNFEMPSTSHDIYVKNIVNAGILAQKVFDVDKYFFSFPISLRREALYAKYNYYNMEFLDNQREDFHEITVGARADMLYFNSLALPISVEYIYNDELKNANEFRVLFDLRL